MILRLFTLIACLYLHEHHPHIGALAWAAAAKDPGLSPELIIGWAGPGNRFRPEDLAELRLGQPAVLAHGHQQQGESDLLPQRNPAR